MRILSGKRARSSAISSGPSITCASLSTTRVAMERLLSTAARQAEGLLREQVAQHLRSARRDGDRARVEICLGPRPAIEGARVAPELRVGARNRHRQLERALLDLAPEELLERGFGGRVGRGVEPRQDAQRVRAEHLRLDPGLRDPRAEGGQVGAPPRAAAPVEVGERARAVLQSDLEVEGPERAPLVRERGADDGPAAVHRTDHVLERHAHVLEEELVELRTAAQLDERPPGDARRAHVDDQAADALVLARLGGAAHEEEGTVGEGRLARPHLLPADYPVVALAPRPMTVRT